MKRASSTTQQYRYHELVITWRTDGALGADVRTDKAT